MSIFFRNCFYFGLKINIKVFLMSGTTYQSIAKASYFSFETAFFRSNPLKKSDNETVKKVHLLLYFVSFSVWFRILYLFCFSTLSDLTFLCHHPIKIFWVSCPSTFFENLSMTEMTEICFWHFWQVFYSSTANLFQRS